MTYRFSFSQSSVPYLAGLLISVMFHAGVILWPIPDFPLQSEKELEEAIEIVVEAPEKPPEQITLVPEIQPELQLESKITPKTTLTPELPSIPVPQSQLKPSRLIAAAPPKSAQNSAVTPKNANITPDSARDSTVTLPNQPVSPPASAVEDSPAVSPDLPAPAAIDNLIPENGKGWGLEQQSSSSEKGDSKSSINGDAEGTANIPQGDSPNFQEETKAAKIPAPPTPPVKKLPSKPECISCPKPQFRGKEGTPKVTYDITADGKVTNIRLRQSSGDPETDRETLEAMSKWQFNPKTVPEGGKANVRVRVTFEESGSQFQRQNEERRREQERLAEQERQRDSRPNISKEQQSKPAYVPPEPAYVPPTTEPE